MERWKKSFNYVAFVAALTLIGGNGSALAQERPSVLGSIEGVGLSAQVYADGSYAISSANIAGAVMRSDVEAVVDNVVLKSSDYPRRSVKSSQLSDELGSGSTLTVTYTGLAGRPDLLLSLRLMKDQAWGEISVAVQNTTKHIISVQSIRTVHAADALMVNLGSPSGTDRILSDSFSEDRPQLAIRDLDDVTQGTPGLHRAVGSQLIYNRQSGKSLFLGALTSERFLTIFHLKSSGLGVHANIVSYDVDSTGTTEILKDDSLKDSPVAEQVELKLHVNPGENLSSERMMFAVGNDYHAQLEQYGQTVRVLHKARVSAPTPIGWWSWTAYYFGVNQQTMATNADWLAQNLKEYGYRYFQIDEGYQYARGEYTSADAARFPLGISYIADYTRHNGLTFGLWTAPFEVSERAWVYQHHKEWLVHNAAGQLIHIGHVIDNEDALYVLDTTHPGAQEYLKQTYTKFRDWGVRFIKMDFMDDTAVEGAYFRPDTSAMQAQRIGLQIIRNAVGDDVMLDKDGGAMLNPVGFVDAGRISQDTAHSFEVTREAASGIAARYYMHRNFFISDPDAFNVSRQHIDDQGQVPLSLDEAKVSIALSAVSGGMFEIGDDLPTLGASAERMALVKNSDLIDMARLGRASRPVDLLTYAPDDKRPSVFLLKENGRQSILTIFNWTEAARPHAINLAQLGLKANGKYEIVDVFGDQDCFVVSSGTMNVVLKPHSVLMLKLIDHAIPVVPLAFDVHTSQQAAAAGETLSFNADTRSAQAPVLNFHWDFGDGTSLDGATVHHAYTLSGRYQVKVTATGLNSETTTKTLELSVTGNISTLFKPSEIKRAE
jgi:hypothetical protein